MNPKTHRRRLLAFLIAGLVALAGWLLLSPPALGISRANYARIQQGMAQQDVEAILGGSPVATPSLGSPVFKVIDGTVVLEDAIMDGLGGAHVRISVSLPAGVDYRRLRPEAWASDAATIIVFFRKDGTVVSKEFFINNTDWSPSLAQRVRMLLGL